jgi:carbon monoxide dehydrogenase subunit G
MASIRQEIEIDVRPEDAWAAVRDFGAVHERLVPGFVVDAEVDGNARTVTFFNGVVAREVLVDVDDDTRRLVYTVVESPLGATHHNAAAQVLPNGERGTRFVWITDVLPDEVAPYIRGMMEQGAGVIKQTLESANAAHG